MAEQTRPSASSEGKKSSLGTGPFLARVISHLDSTFMGGLEVQILKDQSNTAGLDAETYTAKYASPFFGYTPFEFMGQNDGSKSTIDGFNDTQKSYGMWFVPPDVGVNVLVIFVDSDESQCYWFACVPGRYVNNMVPAIAGSTNYQLDNEDKARYGPMKDADGIPLPLPVAEINKRHNAFGDTDGGDREIDPEKIKRVVHPMADRFLEQGLIQDDVRGVTTSSARRSVPSSVFGISTPGPVDRRTNAKKAKIGKIGDTTEPVPVSRLGGTQFVMDDGDDRYHRETTAADGPVKYLDLLDPEVQKKLSQGAPTVPFGEYFRVRTRTGHQILMHNSEDLIYIGNARGTTWIEMTSNGKIDIFAEDSISIHTSNDFNFRADRDINFEAGRNMNFRTESGKWHAEIATNLEFLINENALLTVGTNLDILVGAATKISTNTNLDIAAGGEIRVSATGDLSLGSSAQILETAPTISLNDTTNATPAAVSDFVKPYNLRDNPATSTAAGWEVNQYQAGVVKSFMKRIPMHEPWPLHENQAPTLLTPDNTDREQDGEATATVTPTTPAPTTTAPTAPGTSSGRETEAMKFFIATGWTQVQAAGIVGNLIKESNLNPAAINKNDAGPGKDSVGIAQWNTSRLNNLKVYASSKGKEFTDFRTQLEFINVELNGPERGAAKAIRAATTVEAATIGMSRYERFRGYELGTDSPDTKQRVALANKANSAFA